MTYWSPLSEWQAAPTLANNLLQVDSTLRPTAGGESLINYSQELLCFTNLQGQDLTYFSNQYTCEKKKKHH